MDQTLYQKVKSLFNAFPIGTEFTSTDMVVKTGGNIKKISTYIGSIRKEGAVIRTNKNNPAVYKKVKVFRTEPRKGRIERAREREFSAEEVGEAVIEYIKKLEKANGKKDRRVGALKHKIDRLVKENQELQGKLERSRKNIVVNRKPTGESVRLLLNV